MLECLAIPLITLGLYGCARRVIGHRRDLYYGVRV